MTITERKFSHPTAVMVVLVAAPPSSTPGFMQAPRGQWLLAPEGLPHVPATSWSYSGSHLVAQIERCFRLQAASATQITEPHLLPEDSKMHFFSPPTTVKQRIYYDGWEVPL